MTEEDPAARKARIAARFIEALPHARHLGMQIIETGEGWVLMALDYDPRFVGDPETGRAARRRRHGAPRHLLRRQRHAHPQAPGATATIDLRIDYMRPAQPDRRLFARAECYRRPAPSPSPGRSPGPRAPRSRSPPPPAPSPSRPADAARAGAGGEAAPRRRARRAWPPASPISASSASPSSAAATS